MDDSSNPSALLALRILPHVCAYLPADTHLKCWGQNDYGQLGDGTTTQCTARPRSTSATLLGCWGSEEATLARTSRQAIVKCRGFKGYAARSSQIGDGTTTFRNTPTTINVGGAVGLLALGNSLSLTCESDGQHDPQVLGLHDRGGDCGSGSRLQELQITSRSPGARWNIVSTDRVQVRSRVAGRYRDGNFLPAVAPPERLVDLDPRPRACASPARAGRRGPHTRHTEHTSLVASHLSVSHREKPLPVKIVPRFTTKIKPDPTTWHHKHRIRGHQYMPHTRSRSHEIEIAIQRPRRHQHIRGHQYMPSRSRATSCAHDDTNTSEVTKSEGPVSPGPLSRFCLKASRRNRRRPWPSSPQSSS